MNEEWRVANVLDGAYEVSSLGRIRRAVPGVGTHVGRILSPTLSVKGYAIVRLYRKPRKLNCFLHRLIADTFIGGGDGLQVNHKDGDKVNNRVDNLEFVTGSENVHHAYRIGLYKAPRGERHGMSKLLEDDVRTIRRLYKTGRFTHAKLASRFGVTKENIGSVVLNQTWKHVRDSY